jgi:hypothetical protein
VVYYLTVWFPSEYLGVFRHGKRTPLWSAPLGVDSFRRKL